MTGKSDKSPVVTFNSVEALKPIDPGALQPFMEAMEQAIPEMVKDEEQRQILASESRRRQLKC